MLEDLQLSVTSHAAQWVGVRGGWCSGWLLHYTPVVDITVICTIRVMKELQLIAISAITTILNDNEWLQNADTARRAHENLEVYCPKIPLDDLASPIFT